MIKKTKTKNHIFGKILIIAIGIVQLFTNRNNVVALVHMRTVLSMLNIPFTVYKRNKSSCCLPDTSTVLSYISEKLGKKLSPKDKLGGKSEILLGRT